MDDGTFDEILSLVSQAKSDLYREVGWEDKAVQERVKAARYQLDAALGAARQGDYRQALRLFVGLQSTLQEGNLEPDEWAEIYVAQAICHTRLGEKRAMKKAWKKAQTLEPDNEKLREVAIRLGLVKDS
jgi:tetratricopeptide (TPR) repeat protein